MVSTKHQNSVVDTATAVSAENLKILSERGRTSIENLIAHDVDGAQRHVYADWPPAGTDDDSKRRLVDQVSFLVERNKKRVELSRSVMLFSFTCLFASQFFSHDSLY
jgi:hypothetical protein